ncbi:MAG: AAA family ATPase [bacterium]|nr:AAA family ATPase [bacterium]
MDNFADLAVLINSHYPIICIETFEEARVSKKVERVCRTLDLPLFLWTATQGLVRLNETRAIYKTHSPLDALNFVHSASMDAVYLFKDLHTYFDDPLVIRRLRDLAQGFRVQRRSLVLTAPAFAIPLELQKEIAWYELKLPGRDELRKLVRAVVREIGGKHPIRVEIDAKNGGPLIDSLMGLTLSEAERLVTRAIMEDGRLDSSDIPVIQEAKKDKIAESGILEFFPRRDSFAHIGGLHQLKRWLGVRQGAFSKQASEFGLTAPKGVLLLGVQGCGKSLMAKAIAQEWRLPLLKLDTGRLYNKYLGETEKNFREAIRLSESIAPVILWIDEIEKALAGNHSGEGDGGVATRVLGTLLSWLQEKEAPVFVVATANDITRLPPELLRKGRLDEIFFVDLPNDKEREEIIAVHLNRRKRNPEDFDLAALIKASQGFSGAEIEQAIVSSLYAAFSGKGVLTTETILMEMENTYPLSVVMAEKIHGLRQWAQGRTVQAN